VISPNDFTSRQLLGYAPPHIHTARACTSSDARFDFHWQPFAIIKSPGRNHMISKANKGASANAVGSYDMITQWGRTL